MGLGSTSLNAQPHAGAISCQIKPQEIGTHGYCKVRLRTWEKHFSTSNFCHIIHRRNMKQTAHNNVANAIENQAQYINSETRLAQLDQKVLIFLTYSANAKNLKVSNHSTQSPKQKLDGLLETFDDTTLSQRPDGLIEDTKLKHIFMIEVARTHDYPDSLLRAHVKKMWWWWWLLLLLSTVVYQSKCASYTRTRSNIWFERSGRARCANLSIFSSISSSTSGAQAFICCRISSIACT